jgi:hypothetical protein
LTIIVAWQGFQPAMAEPLRPLSNLLRSVLPHTIALFFEWRESYAFIVIMAKVPLQKIYGYEILKKDE